MKQKALTYRNNAVAVGDIISKDNLDFQTLSNNALTSAKEPTEVVRYVLFHTLIPFAITGKVDVAHRLQPCLSVS